MAPRVFVSHAHKDNEFTKKLVDDLRSAGASVWVDFVDINAGDFLKRISDGLGQSEWCVLVLTTNALASTAVEMEVNAALEMARQGQMKGVIPIVAGPLDVRQVPPLWRPLHRYDATSGYQAALSGLAHSLGLSTSPVPVAPAPAPPAPTPVPANSAAANEPVTVPKPSLRPPSAARSPELAGAAVGRDQPTNPPASQHASTPHISTSRAVSVTIGAFVVAALSAVILGSFTFYISRVSLLLSDAVVFWVMVLSLPHVRRARASTVALIFGLVQAVLLGFIIDILLFGIALRILGFTYFGSSGLFVVTLSAITSGAAITVIAAGFATWPAIRADESLPQPLLRDLRNVARACGSIAVLMAVVDVVPLWLLSGSGGGRLLTQDQVNVSIAVSSIVGGALAITIFAVACRQGLRRIRAPQAIGVPSGVGTLGLAGAGMSQTPVVTGLSSKQSSVPHIETSRAVPTTIWAFLVAAVSAGILATFSYTTFRPSLLVSGALVFWVMLLMLPYMSWVKAAAVSILYGLVLALLLAFVIDVLLLAIVLKIPWGFEYFSSSGLVAVSVAGAISTVAITVIAAWFVHWPEIRPLRASPGAYRGDVMRVARASIGATILLVGVDVMPLWMDSCPFGGGICPGFSQSEVQQAVTTSAAVAVALAIAIFIGAYRQALRRLRTIP